MTKPLTIKLKTLTPLWTGGVDQTCDRLHETGLIGSLRWWYEALVRGLGGSACDPSFEDRKIHPRSSRCPDPAVKEAGAPGHHCVTCELFGCTSWARKFRLQVLDTNENIMQPALLSANTDFALRFIELRPFKAEERWLLAKTLEIAADHGAIGGRTPLKPQKRPRVGDDYGIVQRQGVPELPKLDSHKYQHLGHWRHAQVKEPDFRWFFFIRGAVLWRRQINSIIGLSEDGRRTISNKAFQQFLRGRRGDQNNPAVSKKMFSFRADGGRVWGYAQDNDMRDEIIRKIREELGSDNYSVKTGEQVLHEL